MKRVMLILFCSLCFASNNTNDLKLGCDSGGYKECFNLGFNYYIGRDVKKNLEKVKEYYNKSCDGGFAPSCVGLGIIYHEGEGVSINKAKAKEYFDRACNLKGELGCELSETMKSN